MPRQSQTLWLAAAICFFTASTAHGQEFAMADLPEPEATSSDTSAAVVLHVNTLVDDAISMERPGQYLNAAALYEASAAMLPQGHPDALKYLSRAGLLCYYAGDLDRALALFEEIGREATDVGNTGVAANAYERAMYVAFEQGDKPKAATLYLRSLSKEERDRLLERRKRRQ